MSTLKNQICAQLSIGNSNKGNIGGLPTGLTQGSVVFIGAGSVLAEDNANFFWDNSANHLGIGTKTPAALLDIVGVNQTESLLQAVQTPTEAKVNTIVKLEAASTNWDAGSSVLNIRSRDGQAVPIIIGSKAASPAIQFNEDTTPVGNLYVNTDLFIGSFSNKNIVISPNGNGITKIGSGFATSHGLASSGDLGIDGDLEVNGNAYFDDDIIMSVNSTRLKVPAYGGIQSNTYDNVIYLDLYSQTKRCPAIILDETHNNYILIAEYGDRTYDFAHAIQTNPTMFVHSANQSTSEYLSLTHDQTDGVIGIGAGALKVNGQVFSPTNTLSDGATITPNWNDGNVQMVTLGGNRTLANGTNPKDGAVYTLIVKQDGAGSRTLGYGGKYKWEGGVAPTLSTGSNDIDVLTFVYDGTADQYYGLIAQDFS